MHVFPSIGKPDNFYLAACLRNLAKLYKVQSRYAEAIREKAHGPDHPHGVLAIREKILGPDHPYVANVLENIAECYKEIGQ